MQKYSVFNLIKNAFKGHKDWEVAWKDPTPKAEYDVIIIGGGGHGLATAYYLAKEHNITNVAIVEKGWIGGGNVGRNTTIIRSNYMNDENADFPVTYISFASSKDPNWDNEHPGTATLEAIVPTNYRNFDKWADKPWKGRGDDYEEYKNTFSNRIIEKIKKR